MTDRSTEEMCAEFADTGSIVVHDFLGSAFADQVSDFLTWGMPPDWWFTTIYPGSSSEGRVDTRYVPQNSWSVTQNYTAAYQEFLAGGFSYAFRRTLPHLSGCSCLVCLAISELESEAVRSRVRELTGLPVTRSGGLFASEYSPTSFLAPHTDEDNGRIAIVWQLTRSWQPQFGGLLHLLNADGTEVRRIVVPEFNTAVLFALPEPHGTPHYVSYVPLGVMAKRLAISGWYA